MSFLRRLFGGGGDAENGTAAGAPPAPPVDPAELEAEERARELELLREDQGRLDDLAQRQLRYAQHAWTPEPQGGERRADDEDAATGE